MKLDVKVVASAAGVLVVGGMVVGVVLASGGSDRPAHPAKPAGNVGALVTDSATPASSVVAAPSAAAVSSSKAPVTVRVTTAPRRAAVADPQSTEPDPAPPAPAGTHPRHGPPDQPSGTVQMGYPDATISPLPSTTAARTTRSP